MVLLSSILQVCPNKFNFLSLILCMMFLLLSILFIIFSFVISVVAILHSEFFGSISSQMPPVCSCLFLQRPRFTCIKYYTDYAGYHNVSLGIYANAFAFPDVLEL